MQTKHSLFFSGAENALGACLTVALLLPLAGCLGSGPGGTTASDSGDSTDNTVLLNAITDNVVIPTYQAFADTTQEWSQTSNAIDAYCQALDTVDEASTQAAAQQSWKDAMAYWQQLEAFQFGPIADNDAQLRNEIYSWPTHTNSCTIDQHVVLAESTYDISTSPWQATGLDALEYLLFNTNLDHTCPTQIIETQNWDTRSNLDRKQARCDFAKLIAADIYQNAQILLDEWLPGGNDFAQQLLDSGSEGGAYESQTAALNAISDALFYLDDSAKDRKLALTTGLSADCSQTNCIDQIESPYADNGLANIRNNLIGFENLFTGTPDGLETHFSFDDLLQTKAFPDVADEIEFETRAAIDHIDSSSDSLAESINLITNTTEETACINASANPDTASSLEACQLHGLVKQITDILKGSFVAIVSLNLPSRVEGDND